MKIGELAARTDLNASAIRYYEQCGLLPAPFRRGGQRLYSSDAAHRILLIRFASDMGFTLEEIRIFLNGLSEKTPVGPRWKKLAHRKIKEVDATVERLLLLKSLLERLLGCRCATLQMCVERLSLNAALPVLHRASK